MSGKAMTLSSCNTTPPFSNSINQLDLSPEKRKRKRKKINQLVRMTERRTYRIKNSGGGGFGGDLAKYTIGLEL